MMEQLRTVLVIGATGGIGGETARALQGRGWQVKALHRDPERVRAGDPSFEWVKGDAMDPAAVTRAAEGVAAIVHGANPPGYRNWQGLALPMLESTIAAAAAHGARVPTRRSTAFLGGWCTRWRRSMKSAARCGR